MFSINALLVALLFSIICFVCLRAEFTVIHSLPTDQACEKHSNEPLYAGDYLFTLANVSTQSVQQIMVSMWAYMQDISSTEHTFFAVYSEVPSTKIASLSYQATTQTLFGNLKGTQSGVQSIHKYDWTFIRLLVSLSASAGTPDELLVQFENSSQGLTQTTISIPYSSGSAINTFDRSNIYFNFGLPSTYISEEPSCSIVQNVLIEFNFGSSEWSDVQKFERAQLIRTSILVHYDFFYSQKNQRSLLSYHPYQQRISDVDLTISGSPIALSSQSILSLGPYSMSHRKGVILYFEMRALPASETLNIVNVKLNGLNVFSIFQQTLNGIYEKDSTTNFLFTSVPGAWYQLVVSIKYSMLSSQTIVSISHGNTVAARTFTLLATYAEASFEFGGTTSTSELAIDNIRIYQGTYVKEPSTSCLLQVDGDTDDCLLCQGTFLLDYQQGMICVSSGVSTLKQNIIDWARSDCPQNNMMHLTLDTTCHCLYGFYLSAISNSCESCPSYCRGCLSDTQCIEEDRMRDTSVANGKCKYNLFDDGYNCIKRTFSIPHRINSDADNGLNIIDGFPLTLSDTEPIYIVFVVRMFVEPASPTFSLFKFSDHGQTLFSIVSSKVSSSPDEFKLCYYYHLQAAPFACFPWYHHAQIQLGLWISQSTVIAMVTSNTSFRYLVTNISPLSPHSTPYVCLGDCSYVFTSDTFSFFDPFDGYTKTRFAMLLRQYRILRGMTSPLDFIEDLSMIKPQYGKTFFLLSFETPTLLNPVIHPLKGVKSSEQLLIFVAASSQAFCLISMFYVIFVSRVSILEYKMVSYMTQTTGSPILLEFMLTPHDSRNEAAVKVKYSGESVNTRKCFVKYQTPSFIGFISRSTGQEVVSNSLKDALNLHETDYTISFEIVVNFCRETLRFSKLEKNKINLNSFKILGSSTSTDVYLNKFRVYLYSDVYFDYTLDDPCFLYSEFITQTMRCLKPKEGYAIHGNTVILATACSKLQENGLNKWMYNRYSFECIQTNIAYACAIFDEDDLSVCIQCEDTNADPSDECNCQIGFYLDLSDGICKACLSKCVSCGNDDSCLVCKGSGTVAPDCTCPNEGEYLASTLNYESCSPQCKSCEISSNNCIECASSDRLYAPACYCNPQYFIYDSLTTKVEDACSNIVCSAKCNTCEYSSTNCTECAINRMTPPTCDCEQNYYEVGTTCTSCPSHTFLNAATLVCEPCNYRCLECVTTESTCTECENILFLNESQCVCSDFSSFTLTATGDIRCSEKMYVKLKVKRNKGGNIALVLVFDYPIDEIDFTVKSIDELIFLYFDSIPQNAYQISSAVISDNDLILYLEFFQSFYSLYGSLIFILPEYFLSSKYSKILSEQYNTQALRFEIGSFVIQDGLYDPSDTFQEVNAYLQDSNDSYWLQIIKQLQILYYVVNTLQPQILFIFVNIQIPSNFYEVLQIPCVLVFPYTSEQTRVDTERTYSFFGDALETGKDFSENENTFFRRFGITGSLMVTMPITFIQFMFFSIASLLVNQVVSIKQKIQNTIHPKLIMINDLLRKRTVASIESGFLVFVVLIVNEIQNFNQMQFFYRINVYVGLFTVCMILIVFYRVCIIHKSQRSMKTVEQKEITVKLKREYENQSMAYWNSQIVKKVCMCVVPVLFTDFPNLVIYSQCIVVSISLLVTLIKRPYDTLFGNIVKILGEACQLFIWIYYACYFFPFHLRIHSQEIVSEEDVNEFLFRGELCIWVVIAFNSLYGIEFLVSTISNFTKKKEDISPEEEELRVLNAKRKNKTNYFKGETVTQYQQYKADVPSLPRKPRIDKVYTD